MAAYPYDGDVRDLVARLLYEALPALYRLRDQPRDKFVPGKFIAPHGACFDHHGNIFVVEWVEVGRVTKLRKV